MPERSCGVEKNAQPLQNDSRSAPIRSEIKYRSCIKNDSCNNKDTAKKFSPLQYLQTLFESISNVSEIRETVPLFTGYFLDQRL